MNIQLESRRVQAERSKATALWVIAWCAVIFVTIQVISVMVGIAAAGVLSEALRR